MTTTQDAFNLEWENIRAGQAWAAAHMADDDEAADLCLYYPGAGTYLLDMLQHPRERVAWMEAALAAARRLKEREGETACLVNLGASLFILGEVERAAGCWQESLTLAREIGDRESEGFSINNLATIHLERGDFRTAVPLYQEFLEIALRLGDQRGAAFTLTNLGHCWQGLGEVRRAIDHYEQALAIDRELGTEGAKGEVWATWSALTSIWEISSGPSTSTNVASQSRGRTATARVKVKRSGTWGLLTRSSPRRAEPSNATSFISISPVRRGCLIDKQGSWEYR